MARDTGPVSEDEADELLAPLSRFCGLVVAVSGGADSTALMHLTAGWARRSGRDVRSLIVATVDHGLRPASAAEAAGVRRQAEALGLEHRTLTWCGPKPASGIQAAAREARYAALAQVASQMAGEVGGPVALVTAHNLDDQAETVLMRLARGSGVEGLAAIPREGSAAAPRQFDGGPAPTVVRPLLAIQHARLVATLVAAGIPFAEDPSNHDMSFERVRVRAALASLGDLGITASALARTAERMQRARLALAQATDLLEAAAATEVLGLVWDVELAQLVAAPEEIGIRLLRRLIGRVGGSAPPPELGSLEQGYRHMVDAEPGRFAMTLGGCILETTRHAALRRSVARVYREPDRGQGLPVIHFEPGDSALWDDRFQVRVSAGYDRAVEVGPLGSDWTPLAASLTRLGQPGIPVAALRGMPVFRSGGRLVAVPLLATCAAARGEEAAIAELTGPRDGRGNPMLQAVAVRPRAGAMAGGH